MFDKLFVGLSICYRRGGEGEMKIMRRRRRRRMRRRRKRSIGGGGGVRVMEGGEG